MTLAPEPRIAHRSSHGPCVRRSGLIAVWVAVSARPFLKAARFWSPTKGYYLEAGGIRQSFALSPDGERIFTARTRAGVRVFPDEPEALPFGARGIRLSEPDGQS